MASISNSNQQILRCAANDKIPRILLTFPDGTVVSVVQQGSELTFNSLGLRDELRRS